MVKKPLRVLHDIHWLTRGGIETWLMNLLRHFRNEEVHFDFAVCEPSFYDEEATCLGSKVHMVSHPLHFRNFLRDMRKVMESGNYDAIHSHRPEHGGYLAKIAKELSIPCRVVHAHNTDLCKGKKNLINGLRYCRYRLFGRAEADRNATDLVACSHKSGIYYYGKHFDSNPKGKTVYCGVQLKPFKLQADDSVRRRLQEEHAIAPDSLVIGNVGLMNSQKNQTFLVRVFSELAKRDPRYVLFIAGDGNKRPELEAEVRTLHLEDRVRMPGIQMNVPELECRLFDVFCLPSVSEGLPVSIMEAAAAGLHTVCSDVITREILSVIPEYSTALSLDAPLTEWADALEEGIRRRRTPQEGTVTVRQTPFSIENSAAAFLNIYRRSVEQM